MKKVALRTLKKPVHIKESVIVLDVRGHPMPWLRLLRLM